MMLTSLKLVSNLIHSDSFVPTCVQPSDSDPLSCITVCVSNQLMLVSLHHASVS